jgi:DNA-binding winged helix-turn-helix (wHTH) protein
VSRPAVSRFHGFTLDTEQRLLVRDGEAVHLTRKAFDLLTVLVEHAPAVVTKHDLHRRLWPDTFVTDATVAGVVKELRRALHRGAGEPVLIRTAHGVGYAFAGTLEPIGPSAHGGCWLTAGARRLRLAEGDNDIGRDPAVAIWIDSRDASRRHARIVLRGGAASVEDLGSKNGTWLNERQVTAPTPLQDGDAVRIGTTLLVFSPP